MGVIMSSGKPSTSLIAVLAVLIVVAGVVGYFAGSAMVPAQQTTTVTVTAPGATGAYTVTTTMEKTVTIAPSEIPQMELHTATHIPPNPCNLNPWGECNDHNLIHKIFKQVVENLTNGRVKVIIHTAGELGAEKDNVEHVRAGTIFMTSTSVSVLSSFTNQLLFFDVPGLFQSLDEYWAFAQSDVCKQRLQKAAEDIGNVLIFGPSYYGRRYFATVNKPIYSIDDLKGIKVRVIQSPIVVDAAQRLGLLPIPMPYSEIATALQSGTIQGHDQDLIGYVASKWYEMEKYMAIFPWMIGTHVILINKQQFESMPPSLQAIILTAIQQALQIKSLWDVLYEQIALDTIIKKYMTVTYPDPKPFLEIYSKFLQDHKNDIGEDVLNWLQQYRASKG